MSEEWREFGRCPECGGEVSWAPDYVMLQEGDAIEIGRYRCTECGAESGKRERVLEQGRVAIEPMTGLELGTPVNSPVIGKKKIPFNEIVKRIAKEVHEARLSDREA